jgi:CRP-like cAMP-binding protein
VFSLYELLRNIPLFRSLSNTVLINFADKLILEVVSPEQVIIREGMPGNALYIIKEGSVKVVNYLEHSQEEIILAELGKGDYFGEMSLLTDEPRSASVVALEKTELLRLEKEDFEILVSREPKIYKTLGIILAERLKETTIRRVEAEAHLRKRKFTKGNLQETNLLELLKFADEHHFSGQIRIKRGEDLALLNISKGDLMGIHLNGVSDRDGLKKILPWKEGKFEIIPTIAVRKSPDDKSGKEVSAAASASRDNVLIEAINLFIVYASGLLGNLLVKNILTRTHENLVNEYPVLSELSILANCSVAANEKGDFNVNEKTTIAAAVWLRNLVVECGKVALGFDNINVREITENLSKELEQVGFYQFYETVSGIDFE